MIGNECKEFRVLSPESFYPLSWLDWKKVFHHPRLFRYGARKKSGSTFGTKWPLNIMYIIFRPSLCPDCWDIVFVHVRNCIRSVLILLFIWFKKNKMNFLYSYCILLFLTKFPTLLNTIRFEKKVKDIKSISTIKSDSNTLRWK